MKKRLISSFLALGLTAGAHAQTIISYSADTANDTLRSDASNGYLWSDSSALITSSGDDVFGGAFGDNSLGATIGQWTAGNTTSSNIDAWRLDVDFDAVLPADFGFLLKTGSNPTLNAGDTFSTIITNEAGDRGDIRWLINNNSKFYVSDIISDVKSKGDTVAAATVSSSLSG